LENFSFLFDIILYYGISKETIRMPFRGLTMLKSPKLTIKGGLCYGFAMVIYFLAIMYHHNIIIREGFKKKNMEISILSMTPPEVWN